MTTEFSYDCSNYLRYDERSRKFIDCNNLGSGRDSRCALVFAVQFNLFFKQNAFVEL